MPDDKISPPGPKGRPIVGNAMAFSANPLDFLLKCSRDYGDVVRIARRTYLVSHPELIRQLFHDKGETFAKVDAAGDDENRSAFPASMMNSAGPDWQDKRRKLQPVFQKELILRSVEQVSIATNAFIAAWEPGPLDRDTREDMGGLCMEIGSRFLFGASTGQGETVRFAGMADAIMKLKRSQIRIPRSLPTPGNLRLRRTRRELDAAMDGIVERYRRSPSNPDCLLGTLLAEDGSGKSAWLRDELATMILSGLEPMADALTWTFYLLARHADAQLELHREIDAVMGERNAMVADDLPSLRLTEAVVKEALRLYPPAWMTGRTATRDCSLGGFHVPAGTMLAVSQWVSHRDPRYFESPDEFQPQRWLNRERVDGLPSYAYFPFGGGFRKCIGTHLSLTQMLAVVVSIVRSFDMRLVPGAKVETYPALVLRPVGVRLSMTPRRTTPRSTKTESETCAR